VIGGGHNGLVCGTFLARAGMDVLVVEANDEPGGCIWSETLPSGHRIERGAIEHGIILDIARELELGRYGLEYVFRDALVGAGFGDGTSLVFYTDLEATVETLRRHAPQDEAGYRNLARLAGDLLAMLGTFPNAPSLTDIAAFSSNLGTDALRLLLMSAEKVVGSYVTDSRLTSALTMYAAHAQLPPWLPGTGLFGLLLAGSHGRASGRGLFGLLLAGSHGQAPGRPRGGSSSLTLALVEALRAAGGELRTGATVTRIEAVGGGGSITLNDGDEIAARNVVSTLDVMRTAGMFTEPPDDLAWAARTVASGSLNVAELKVDLALTAPPRPGFDGPPEALWLLQPEPDSLRRSYAEIMAGDLPSEPSMMWAAPSALDPSAAPPGAGTLWLSAFVPAKRRHGEWDQSSEEAAAEWLLDGFEAITGIEARADMIDMRVTGPASWQRRIGAIHGNPNHLDLTVDQLFTWRPPTGGGYRTELDWMYLSGAGTYPGGGLSGLPGRNTAMAVLGDGGRGRKTGGWRSDIAALRRGWRLFRTLRRRR